jgi:hypothetical protein
MLRRYTTSSFSGHSTSPRPRCYTSEGNGFALPGQKHLYPLHHHSRTQTRGRSNIASLAYILRFFLCNTFFSSRQTRSQGTFYLGLWPAFGHGLHIIGRNKLDVRNGLLARISPLLVLARMCLCENAVPMVPVRVLEVECHLPALGL